MINNMIKYLTTPKEVTLFKTSPVPWFEAEDILFREGNWGIKALEATDDYRKYTESCIFHECPEFKDPEPHHWYHSIDYDVGCSLCQTQWPDSVATLWKLQNFDNISCISYILVLVNKPPDLKDFTLKKFNKTL